jgi:hypothetical protein
MRGFAKAGHEATCAVCAEPQILHGTQAAVSLVPLIETQRLPYYSTGMLCTLRHNRRLISNSRAFM